MEKCQNLSQILSGSVIIVFECLQRISLYERVEVVDSVNFNQLVLNFEDCLENIIKQLKLLWFPVKRGHWSGSDFGNSEILWMLLLKFA